MKECRQLELSWWQVLSHYAFVLFLLIVPAMDAYYLWMVYTGNPGSGIRTESELIWGALPFLLAAVMFYFIQKRRLRFQEINLQCNENQFREALERTSKDMGWQIENKHRSYIRAHRLSNLTLSWGEMITLIRLDGKLLVNSICDPDGPVSVASFGWNKRNIQVFTAHLQDVLSNNPLVYRNPLRTENPKSLKARLIRILAYFFSLLFIGISILFFRDGVLGLAITLLALGIGYLYLDIRNK